MRTLAAYLQLVRLPTVFTALADIFLGFLLTHRGLEPLDDFGLLLGTSACLYLAGMVFNDVFDRRVDAEQRPTRPIPSGRVSLRGAAILGSTLILVGLVLATLIGRSSLEVALLLAVAVLAYDSLLKKTPLGPPAMGACRFLNVMLGASATFFVWAKPQLYIALALGVYITGVTWFARTESEQSRRGQLAGSAVLLNLGLLMLLVLPAGGLLPNLGTTLVPLVGNFGEEDPAVVLFILAVVMLTIDRRVIAALVNPSPARVQTTVKTMLLSLVVLDATLILFKTGHAGYATATVALLVPALLLGRWIPVT